MFKVIEYNTATGHREVVGEFLDTDDYPKINVGRNDFRRVTVEMFAEKDTNTDHTYFASDVE